jgi:hypothetical protein
LREESFMATRRVVVVHAPTEFVHDLVARPFPVQRIIG